jgi:hypothetical protein
VAARESGGVVTRAARHATLAASRAFFFGGSMHRITPEQCIYNWIKRHESEVISGKRYAVIDLFLMKRAVKNRTDFEISNWQILYNLSSFAAEGFIEITTAGSRIFTRTV